jgi:tRNA threonylcarbamoyladenosine biosynthesis protein TsaE
LLDTLVWGGVQEDISTGWAALWQEAVFAGEALANAKPAHVRPDAADVDLRNFPFNGPSVWLLRQLHVPPGRRAIITLTGDLGSGKTCFVQGLARGLQVPQNAYVTSPSYTLIHTYRGRSLLHHVDLYRLSGGDIEGIGLLDLLEDSAVIAIEWPERLGEDLPEDHLAVDIHLIGETSRRIQITAYGLGPAILLKELQNII